MVLDGWVLKQFGYYRKHFNSLELNFHKHAGLRDGILRFCLTTSVLSYYFSCPCAAGFDSVQGVHRARLLVSTASMRQWWRLCCLASATKTAMVSSFPSSAHRLGWLV